MHETRLVSLHHNPGTYRGKVKSSRRQKKMRRVDSPGSFLFLVLDPVLSMSFHPSLGGDIHIIIVTIKEGGSDLLTTSLETME